MYRAACVWLVVLLSLLGGTARAADAPPLRLAWDKDILTIHGDHLPGKDVRIRYLEAYCRPGSTDREWGETCIGHKTRLVSADKDGRKLALACKLNDGVEVNHEIAVVDDGVTFDLVAHNPTDTASEAHWAQPCIAVDKFTGRTQQDYIPQCFVLLDGKVTRLPTEPWATKARYVPGQVYCPKHVDRNDVNPRPLSDLVPSHGLIGCFSPDARWILATAWEPYQELFQGVAVCIHSDFRIGGLKAGETKKIRGKIYLTNISIEELVKRYEREFAKSGKE